MSAVKNYGQRWKIRKRLKKQNKKNSRRLEKQFCWIRRRALDPNLTLFFVGSFVNECLFILYTCAKKVVKKG